MFLQKFNSLKENENLQIHSLVTTIKEGVYANRMKDHKPIMNEQRVQIHLINYLERAFKDIKAKSKPASLLESMKTEAINNI